MQEKAWWARSVVVLALLVGAPGVAMAGNGRAAVTATRGGTDAAEGEGAKKVEGPSTPLRWADETTSPRPAPGADPLYRHCGERDMGLVQAAGAIIRRRVAGLPPPSPPRAPPRPQPPPPPPPAATPRQPYTPSKKKKRKK
ncbi:MAG: hypothetical protein KC731_05605 [Myxococcales bacterium]|nr:hypothetical protein [Myxococcales bacterium]